MDNDKTLTVYCNKYGFKINNSGIIELTRQQAQEEKAAGWMEKALFEPGLCWVVPSDNGTILLFENKHFIIK